MADRPAGRSNASDEFGAFVEMLAVAMLLHILAGVFTPEQRCAVRDLLLERAQADEKIIAAALTGSGSHGAEDRWSDVDLYFGVAEGTAREDALNEWSSFLWRELGALHHFDLDAGYAIYRGFLLPGGLEVTSRSLRRLASVRWDRCFAGLRPSRRAAGRWTRWAPGGPPHRARLAPRTPRADGDRATQAVAGRVLDQCHPRPCPDPRVSSFGAVDRVRPGGQMVCPQRSPRRLSKRSYEASSRRRCRSPARRGQRFSARGGRGRPRPVGAAATGASVALHARAGTG